MLAVALLPLLMATVPPLVDYPAHLAQAHIIAHADDISSLRRNYQVAMWPFPNIGMELVVSELSRFMSVYDAGRLFIAGSVIALFAGMAALQTVLNGRIGLGPLAASLILYSSVFSLGDVGFNASVGLFLLAVAGWIIYRQKCVACRTITFAVVSSLLYLTHVVGLFGYALVVLLIEVPEAIKNREFSRSQLVQRLVPLLGQFFPAAVMFAMAAGSLFSEFDTGASWFGDIHSKPYSAASPFLTDGAQVKWIAIVVLSILVAAGLYWRWLILTPVMRLPIIALTVAALIMPQVFQGIWLDGYLFTLLAALAIASVHIDIPNRSIVLAGVAAIAMIFAARVATVSQNWRTYDRHAEEFRTATRVIYRGARVLTVHDGQFDLARTDRASRWSIGHFLEAKSSDLAAQYRGLANLAVIERSSYLPSMFMDPKPHIIEPVRSARRLTPTGSAPMISTRTLRDALDPEKTSVVETLAAEHGFTPYWLDWHHRYKYVVVLHREPTGEHPNPLPSRLRQIGDGSLFTIYAVQQPKVKRPKVRKSKVKRSKVRRSKSRRSKVRKSRRRRR